VGRSGRHAKLAPERGLTGAAMILDEDAAMAPNVRAVFVFARDDGDLLVFPSIEAAASYIEAIDVNDGVYEALYTLDGWVSDPRPDRSERQVELVVSGKQDVDGLLQRVADRRPSDHRLSPGDLPVIANEALRREWSVRWPRWPKWLDRRLHGGGPPHV
jgi:hypothetical protein